MKVIVMRGVSGSGKSTKAEKLIQEFLATNPDGTTYICSADKFFVDPASGEYKFDPKKIGVAHAQCKGTAYAAMDIGVDLVVIDNTATCKWEYESYEKLAAQFGYEFETCVVGNLDEKSLKEYASRCVHNVPLDTIRRMAKRFE